MSRSRARRPGLSLATQILVLQLLVVLLTVAVAAAVGVLQVRAQITRQEGARALAVAESLAATPAVQRALSAAGSTAELQPLAESVRKANDLTFVVIADADQIRLTHPDPSLIGQRLSTDASDALAGRNVVTTERGTLGRSVRAKVPIRDEGGDVVGVASVGSLVAKVGDQLQDALPRLFAYAAGALALGVLGSLLLARRLKRQTFGLEPAEIGQLLEQREATLHGIREGLLAVDGRGRITLVNDEAVRLLGLPGDSVGRDVTELDLPPRLQDVLFGRTAGDDEIVLRRGRVLVLNRMPINVRGSGVGAVVTLRDRTELEDLTRQLDGAHSVGDALRAQAHEFSNRMHTVAGLLELGEHDEARRFVECATTSTGELAARLTAQVGEPAVATLPAGTGADVDALVTVVGNLVDNAVDALGGRGGWVEVSLEPQPEGVLIEVRDNGPGVAPELADEVFRHGFTTKVAESAGYRGLGLALTRQACVTRGGWVSVSNDDGAVFKALLPYDAVPAP